ncbi:LysR substrate binding domain-containing protein [Isoptericola jiangsuensis]|uniref:LysR substrate binding domain-containing protein n=1 Tax=Isoptericola jiangsuensis TaxID=548579 RepID=A0A2A9EZ65_9MICO|nr:LysR substrate binding domain-containing protein [Isoptericola jiangsuensis]
MPDGTPDRTPDDVTPEDAGPADGADGSAVDAERDADGADGSAVDTERDDERDDEAADVPEGWPDVDPDDELPEEPDDGRPVFRWGYVPGATPGKWARTWRDRVPDVRLELVQVEAAAVEAALRTGDVDAALGRLPVDADDFHAIRLYEEVPVVVVSKDHLLAATEEDEHVAAADLAEDVVWVAADDVLFGGDEPRPGRAPEVYDDGSGTLVTPAPSTTAEAVAWTANGSGITVVPMSLARLHHRKDVVHRLIDDAPLAPVGLVWSRDRDDDLVQELVGIVRGRTANSSRGPRAAEAPAEKKSRDTKGRGARAGAGGASKGGSSRGQAGRGGPRKGGTPGGKGSGRGPKGGKGGRSGGRGRR